MEQGVLKLPPRLAGAVDDNRKAVGLDGLAQEVPHDKPQPAGGQEKQDSKNPGDRTRDGRRRQLHHHDQRQDGCANADTDHAKGLSGDEAKDRPVQAQLPVGQDCHRYDREKGDPDRGIGCKACRLKPQDHGCAETCDDQTGIDSDLDNPFRWPVQIKQVGDKVLHALRVPTSKRLSLPSDA